MKNIELKSMHNIRDFGGTKTLDGKIIKSKMFIRSGSLHNLSKSDLDILRSEYNLKTVIDLRTPTEVEEKPDSISNDINYYNISLLNKSVFGITHEHETQAGRSMPNMSRLYKNIVSKEHSVRALRDVLHTICEASQNGAVLWHCSEGKDRCGIVSALFLSMLNVDRYTIYDDYMVTNETALKKAQKYYWLTLLKKHSIEAANAMRESLVADEQYLQAAFDAIDDKFDGMNNYLTDVMKITPDVTRFINDNCLKNRKNSE